MGEGEFVCELRERDETGATGADEAAFLVRPNAGLPFAPVAETASGGELSRIALAIAPSPEATRSCSTRSTPASAARPRMPSAGC
jgi:ATPase involved in DNA repair